MITDERLNEDNRKFRVYKLLYVDDASVYFGVTCLPIKRRLSNRQKQIGKPPYRKNNKPCFIYLMGVFDTQGEAERYETELITAYRDRRCLNKCKMPKRIIKPCNI